MLINAYTNNHAFDATGNCGLLWPNTPSTKKLLPFCNCVLLIIFLSMVELSHRKPASARTSHDNCLVRNMIKDTSCSAVFYIKV
jgi:hypothetical protein